MALSTLFVCLISSFYNLARASVEAPTSAVLSGSAEVATTSPATAFHCDVTDPDSPCYISWVHFSPPDESQDDAVIDQAFISDPEEYSSGRSGCFATNPDTTCGWTGDTYCTGCENMCLPTRLSYHDVFDQLFELKSLTAGRCAALAGVVHGMLAILDIQASMRIANTEEQATSRKTLSTTSFGQEAIKSTYADIKTKFRTVSGRNRHSHARKLSDINWEDVGCPTADDVDSVATLLSSETLFDGLEAEETSTDEAALGSTAAAAVLEYTMEVLTDMDKLKNLFTNECYTDNDVTPADFPLYSMYTAYEDFEAILSGSHGESLSVTACRPVGDIDAEIMEGYDGHVAACIAASTTSSEVDNAQCMQEGAVEVLDPDCFNSGASWLGVPGYERVLEIFWEIHDNCTTVHTQAECEAVTFDAEAEEELISALTAAEEDQVSAMHTMFSTSDALAFAGGRCIVVLAAVATVLCNMY